MKNFNADNFITTLKEVPWDTVFLFDDINDMLESWESLFNSELDSHCPWRNKRVKNLKQATWITKPVLQQLHLRDNCLKTARISSTSDDLEKYKAERNKAVSMMRSAKRSYFNNVFDEQKNNPKAMWNTVKYLIGCSKGKKAINSIKDGVYCTDDNQQKASLFNKYFASLVDYIRSTMPISAFNIDRLINFSLPLV